MVLEDEISIFDLHREDFERDHLGEFVVIHKDVLVGFYPDLTSAAMVATANYGKGPYLIREIGDSVGCQDIWHRCLTTLR